MRIIDEKGRLFGKVNIIDFLVFALLVCFIPLFYFFHNMLTIARKPVQPERSLYLQAEIAIKFIKISPEILKLIAVGDEELDRDGIVISQIVWLGASSPYKYKFNIGGSKIVIKEDPILKEISARIKIKSDIRNDGIYYHGQMLPLTSQIGFRTAKYNVYAINETETDKESTLYATRDLDLYVILKDLDENTLKLISLGDKELDKQGEVIAEILDIGRAEPNNYEVYLGDGNYLRAEDGSGKKQLKVKMRLKCQLSDTMQLYFKGRELNSNSLLEFMMGKYTAFGKMSMIYEIVTPESERQWICVKVKFSGVIPEVSNVVTAGDIEKDMDGRVTARLKNIISNKSSDILSLKDNKWIVLTHPFQKDIVAIFDLLCIEKGGTFYFKNYPVKMGNMITFVTDLYSITGIIIGLDN